MGICDLVVPIPVHFMSNIPYLLCRIKPTIFQQSIEESSESTRGPRVGGVVFLHFFIRDYYLSFYNSLIGLEVYYFLSVVTKNASLI